MEWGGPFVGERGASAPWLPTDHTDFPLHEDPDDEADPGQQQDKAGGDVELVPLSARLGGEWPFLRWPFLGGSVLQSS